MTAEGWVMVITAICTMGALPLAKVWFDSKTRLLSETVDRLQKEMTATTNELGEVGYRQSRCSRREAAKDAWIEAAVGKFARQDAQLARLPGYTPEPLLTPPPPPPDEEEERAEYAEYMVKRAKYRAALSDAVTEKAIGGNKP